MSKVFDVIIVGAGASGLACAYFLKTNKVIIIDKYEGARKLAITGNNRCNITNNLPFEEFLLGYSKNGQFLRDTFNNFFRDELLFWLKKLSIEIQEENGKFFLKNVSSKEFSSLLKSKVETKMKIKKFEPVISVKKLGNIFTVQTLKGEYKTLNLVLATGGKSYPQTGSDGSGYSLAKQLGHTVVDLEPIEVPFCLKNSLNHLKGISLRDISVTLKLENKRITERGDIIFTHFGLSGPVILKLSANSFKEAKICIKLLDSPKYTVEKLHLHKGKTKNYLSKLLPKRLTELMPHKELQAANLNKKQLKDIENFLNNFCIKVTKCGFKRAFVTKGGVSIKEINPKTFESKIIKNLFFCGEMVDIQGSIGGFNLQYAFSSGYTVASTINNKIS